MEGGFEMVPLLLLADAASQTAAAASETTSITIAKNLVDLAFTIVPKFLWAIGILLITRFAISLIGRITRRVLQGTEPTLRKFFVQIAEFLALIAGLIAALNTIGIQTATLVAVLGAAGLAVGLALQNTLSHFAAGVMLISFRPFEAGDLIEGAGVSGIVDNVGIFSTTIITPDNIKIVVPNSNLFSGTLKNLTAMGTRRVDLEVDIGDRPIEGTITHLLSLVQPHPLVLNDPKTTCNVLSVSQEKTVLYLRPWCACEVYEQVRSEIQHLVREALYEVQIETSEG